MEGKSTGIEQDAANEGSISHEPTKDVQQALEESHEEVISQPGGFRNDPSDPSNPNEVRERALRKLRP
jgi:hypothetical protein